MIAVHDFLLINEAIIYWIIFHTHIKKKKMVALFFVSGWTYVGLEFIAVNFTPAWNDLWV